jgi:hypothetical protein
LYRTLWIREAKVGRKSRLRLWTIQPFSVWTQVREDGEARVLPARWSHPDHTPVSYDWLRGELAGRVKNYQGGYPWWCYCEKPDLRIHRHGSLSGGKQQVRLELEVDPARVSVFRIWAWNRIYCGMYLGSLRQERDWRRRRRESFVDRDLRDWELGPPWRAELEASWQRLFLPLPKRSNDCFMPSGHEAVVEVLRLADVRKVDHFETTYESFEARLAAMKLRPSSP